MKLKNKITFLFMLISAATILLLSTFIYLYSLHFTNQNFFIRLKARTSIAFHKYQEENATSKPFYDEVRKKHLVMLQDEKEYVIRLDENKRLFKNSDTIGLPSDFLELILKNGYGEYKNGNIFFVGLYNPAEDKNVIIIMSARDEEGEAHLNALRNVLITGFILSSLLIAIAGVVISNRMLNPLIDIIREANRITASNLHLRLPEDDGKDELSLLKNTFNNMLDRLESSFEMQSNFVSNASHELRTPLTTLLGESELALKKLRSQAEYVQSLNIIHQEAIRLDQLISSLLKLSQLGFDGKKLAVETMRMDELLMNIKADIDRRIPDNKVVMEWDTIPPDSETVLISVNRLWMKLAIINIIHNGIKYSDNQKVSVTMSVKDKLIEVRITDTGIGIPAEDIVHVFEPFYRGSNTANFQGYGIGLPLSLKIIRLHNGKISVNSQKDKGTTVSIFFNKE